MDRQLTKSFIEHYWDLDKYITNHIYKLDNLRNQKIFKEDAVVIGSILSVVAIGAITWLIKTIWEDTEKNKNSSSSTKTTTTSNTSTSNKSTPNTITSNTSTSNNSKYTASINSNITPEQQKEAKEKWNSMPPDARLSATLSYFINQKYRNNKQIQTNQVNNKIQNKQNFKNSISNKQPISTKLNQSKKQIITKSSPEAIKAANNVTKVIEKENQNKIKVQEKQIETIEKIIYDFSPEQKESLKKLGINTNNIINDIQKLIDDKSLNEKKYSQLYKQNSNNKQLLKQFKNDNKQLKKENEKIKNQFHNIYYQNKDNNKSFLFKLKNLIKENYYRFDLNIEKPQDIIDWVENKLNQAQDYLNSEISDARNQIDEANKIKDETITEFNNFKKELIKDFNLSNNDNIIKQLQKLKLNQKQQIANLESKLKDLQANIDENKTSTNSKIKLEFIKLIKEYINASSRSKKNKLKPIIDYINRNKNLFKDDINIQENIQETQKSIDEIKVSDNNINEIYKKIKTNINDKLTQAYNNEKDESKKKFIKYIINKNLFNPDQSETSNDIDNVFNILNLLDLAHSYFNELYKNNDTNTTIEEKVKDSNELNNLDKLAVKFMSEYLKTNYNETVINDLLKSLDNVKELPNKKPGKIVIPRSSFNVSAPENISITNSNKLYEIDIDSLINIFKELIEKYPNILNIDKEKNIINFDKLLDSIKESDEEIKKLQEEVETYKKQAEESQHEFSNSLEELIKSKASSDSSEDKEQIKNLKEIQKLYNDNISDKTKFIEELAKLVANKNNSINNDNEIQKYQLKINELNNDIDRLTNSLAYLNDMNYNLQQEIESLKNQIKSLENKTSNEDDKKSFNTITQSIDELYNIINTENDNSESDIINKIEFIKSKFNEISNKSKEFLELEQKLSELEQKLSKSEKTNEELNDKISTLENELNGYRKTAEEIKSISNETDDSDLKNELENMSNELLIVINMLQESLGLTGRNWEEPQELKEKYDRLNDLVTKITKLYRENQDGFRKFGQKYDQTIQRGINIIHNLTDGKIEKYKIEDYLKDNRYEDDINHQAELAKSKNKQFEYLRDSNAILYSKAFDYFNSIFGQINPDLPKKIIDFIEEKSLIFDRDIADLIFEDFGYGDKDYYMTEFYLVKTFIYKYKEHYWFSKQYNYVGSDDEKDQIYNNLISDIDEMNNIDLTKYDKLKMEEENWNRTDLENISIFKNLYYVIFGIKSEFGWITYRRELGTEHRTQRKKTEKYVKKAEEVIQNLEKLKEAVIGNHDATDLLNKGINTLTDQKNDLEWDKIASTMAFKGSSSQDINDAKEEYYNSLKVSANPTSGSLTQTQETNNNSENKQDQQLEQPATPEATPADSNSSQVQQDQQLEQPTATEDLPADSSSSEKQANSNASPDVGTNDQSQIASSTDKDNQLNQEKQSTGEQIQKQTHYITTVPSNTNKLDPNDKSNEELSNIEELPVIDDQASKDFGYTNEDQKEFEQLSTTEQYKKSDEQIEKAIKKLEAANIPLSTQSTFIYDMLQPLISKDNYYIQLVNLNNYVSKSICHNMTKDSSTLDSTIGIRIEYLYIYLYFIFMKNILNNNKNIYDEIDRIDLFSDIKGLDKTKLSNTIDCYIEYFESCVHINYLRFLDYQLSNDGTVYNDEIEKKLNEKMIDLNKKIVNSNVYQLYKIENKVPDNYYMLLIPLIGYFSSINIPNIFDILKSNKNDNLNNIYINLISGIHNIEHDNYGKLIQDKEDLNLQSLDNLISDILYYENKLI